MALTKREKQEIAVSILEGLQKQKTPKLFILLRTSTLVLSFILLIVLGVVMYEKVINSDKANAATTCTYNEDTVVNGGFHAKLSTGFVQNPGWWVSGMPTNGETCSWPLQYFDGPGGWYVHSICAAVATSWQTTGSCVIP